MIGSVLNGIRISAGVSATSTVTTGNTGTMYTCPASSYAIVQVYVEWASNFSGSASILVDDKIAMYFDDTTAALQVRAPITNMIVGSLTHPDVMSFTIGPSQTLKLQNAGGSTATYHVSGVCFISGT